MMNNNLVPRPNYDQPVRESKLGPIQPPNPNFGGPGHDNNMNNNINRNNSLNNPNIPPNQFPPPNNQNYPQNMPTNMNQPGAIIPPNMARPGQNIPSPNNPPQSNPSNQNIQPNNSFMPPRPNPTSDKDLIISDLGQWNQPFYLQRTQANLTVVNEQGDPKERFELYAKTKDGNMVPVISGHSSGNNQVYVEVPSTGKFHPVKFVDFDKPTDVGKEKIEKDTPLWSQSMVHFFQYIFDVSGFMLCGIIILNFLFVNSVLITEFDFLFILMNYIVAYRFLATFLNYFALFSYFKRLNKLKPIKHGITTDHIVNIFFLLMYFIIFICTLLISPNEIRLYSFYVQRDLVYISYMQTKLSESISFSILYNDFITMNCSQYMSHIFNIINVQFACVLIIYFMSGLLFATRRRPSRQQRQQQ